MAERIRAVRGRGISSLIRSRLKPVDITRPGANTREGPGMPAAPRLYTGVRGAPGAPSGPSGPKPNSKLAWSPFDPNARPPSGSYDPAIDASADAATRGWNYSQEDYTKNTGRLNADYAISTENLGRKYDFLASSQNQRARQMGVDAGGWAEASQQTRAGNKGREQDSLRLSWERAMSDQLESNTRAGLENEAFQGAAQGSRVFQANQATPGWANIDKITAAGYRVDNVDRADANGPYRLARHLKKGTIVRVRPNGTIERR